MPSVPMRSENFPDLLNPTFERLFNEEYDQHEDYIPYIFDSVTHNGRDRMSYSSLSSLADFDEFDGSIRYQSQAQGYDITMIFREFVSGTMLERKLFDDDQYHAFEDTPKALAAAAARTRQKHAARIFNNAFSNDTYFYQNSEQLALCSNSHTTTTGASTAEGFDNLHTGELSAVSVQTMRNMMVELRGPIAEKITIKPDELWFPTGKQEIAFEIINSAGKLNTANNNVNVHQGRFTGREWTYLTDTDNFFLCSSPLRRQACKWSDRIPLEKGFVEDFDTMTSKYRAYMRYAYLFRDWRWIVGSQVA